MVRIMRRGNFGVFAMLAAMALLCMLAGSSTATAGDTTLASVDSSGKQANPGFSSEGDISANGRYVAFTSTASNLDPDREGTTPYRDVFVRDRQTGTTERVSVSGDGTAANADSFLPSISADGRYIAFVSEASNLVPGDTNDIDPNNPNDGRDVFVRDLQAQTTERVSVDSSGNQGNGLSFGPSISADGRYVAFNSGSSNLVPNDANNGGDVFVHERHTGTTQPQDSTAPSTTASATISTGAPYEPGTSTNKHVKVTLNAQDNDGGSGVAKISYSASGAQTIVKTDAPSSSVEIPLSQEGTTTLTYYATDEAGNVEAPETLTIKIDKTPPRVDTVSPINGAKTVARSTNPRASFSEKMAPTSIATSTFKLFRCSSTTSTNCATQVTDVSVTPSADRLSATLNPFPTSPTALLAGRTKYKVVVTTGAKDEAGNLLDQNTSTAGNQNKVWYFTTGSS